MAEWERTQKDAIDERKDRSRSSDAERQRQYHGEREARRFAQLPKCISKILAICFEPKDGSLVPVELLRQLYSTVCTPRGNACFVLRTYPAA